MTIARQGRSLTFTAVNEGINFNGVAQRVIALSFQGSGLTAGQRLLVRDTHTPGTGSIVTDYLTEAATDNADLWGGRAPQQVEGLAIDNNTIGGTWVLTVTVEV